MFQQFEGLSNRISTRTDLRLMLQDADSDDPAFTRELNFTADGTMVVQIGQMFRTTAAAIAAHEPGMDASDEPRFVLPWTVTEMSARADSEMGEITVTNFADRPTFGTVKQLKDNSPFPAVLEAEVCAAVNVPGFGELRTANPVPIRAEIDSVPPFGVEAKHANSGILVDADSVPRGMIIGRSITLIGPA